LPAVLVLVSQQEVAEVALDWVVARVALLEQVVRGPPHLQDKTHHLVVLVPAESLLIAKFGLVMYIATAEQVAEVARMVRQAIMDIIIIPALPIFPVAEQVEQVALL
jgi:hypothetical protein